MFEVRENGLVVIASGWGKEVVGQQQNPAEQTPFAFPCQPRNEGQTTALLSFCPPCSAAENRAQGNSPGLSWGQGPGNPGSDWGKISAETREP